MRSSYAARALGYKLYSKHAKYPVRHRPEENDIDVFSQIFVRGDYAGLGEITPGGVIFDCGANVGYSAAWLLTKYPHARLIAVEADPVNFRLLSQNLKPYGDRVTPVNNAVWSHKCELVFETDSYREGRGWAMHVREARSGERPDLRAVDIPTLMKIAQVDRVALLTMDVERTELQIFRRDTEWLSQVDAIAVKLSDPAFDKTFFTAIEGQNFFVQRFGELTICRRVSSE